MSWSSYSFIFVSVLYLLGAVVIGVWMTFAPGSVFVGLRVHSHLMVIGWVSMLIFGVAYHVLPRFSGRPLYSEKLAVAHFFLVNIGLLGMVISWAISRGLGVPSVEWVAPGFGIATALGMVFFAVNIWKTIRREVFVEPPRMPR